MFGAFRCSKDARNNLEYVDLSGNSRVDGRNYTVLVSKPFHPLDHATLILKSLPRKTRAHACAKAKKQYRRVIPAENER